MTTDTHRTQAGQAPAREPGLLRPAALVAGLGLAAMAVLSPLGIMVALPGGHAGLAALTVLVVAVLDVVVAVALVPFLAPGGQLLARSSAALRIAYAAGFAVAAGALFAPPDEMRFQAIWDAAMVFFAAHLVVAGVAAIRGGPIPTWIGALLIVAGAGYAADSVVAALSPDAGVSVSSVAFVGEVALLVWLVLRGGRAQTDGRRGGRPLW